MYLDQPGAVGLLTTTGYVIIVGGSGHYIHWGHASTTMDPRWFGRSKSGGAYSTELLAASKSPGNISSSLAFVGESQIMTDRPIEDPLSQSSKSDNGKVYTTYYGTHNRRELMFRNSGIPRSSEDTPYQSMRRFVGEARKGLGFYFFPDTAVASYAVYDPDDQTVVRQWGWERFTFDPNQPVSWDEQPEYPQYYRHWRKRFTCARYVA